jgi:large subunit GTPase 1
LEEGGTGTPTASELLASYAKARGFQTQGVGQPDESRAARTVLKDYVNGKLLYCDPPPGYPDAAEFNRDLYDSEHLPPKRRAQLAAAMEAMEAMDLPDDESTVDTEILALPAGAKSKRLDKAFFAKDGGGAGHRTMPFSYKYTEQGIAKTETAKQLSGRKARQMIALETGLDLKDVLLSTGKKHFKGGAKGKGKKKVADD